MPTKVAQSGPNIFWSESYSNKLKIREISTFKIRQPFANPTITNPTINQRFSQTANYGATNCAT